VVGHKRGGFGESQAERKGGGGGRKEKKRVLFIRSNQSNCLRRGEGGKTRVGGRRGKNARERRKGHAKRTDISILKSKSLTFVFEGEKKEESHSREAGMGRGEKS